MKRDFALVYSGANQIKISFVMERRGMLNRVLEAESYFAEGRIPEARVKLLEILEDDSQNKEALNNLGVIAFAEGKFGQASTYFSQALEIDPYFKDAIINICDLLRVTGDLNSSLSLLEMAVQKYPEDKEINNLFNEACQSAIDTVHNDSSINNPVSHLQSPASNEEMVKPLRVLQGTYEIANQSNTISQALSNSGLHSKTLCYYPNYLKYKSDYVMDLSMFGNQKNANSQTIKYAEQLIPQFDIFHFHFGTTLTLDNSDLPLLKAAGKKKVMHYWGSEIRMLSRAKEINRYIKVKAKSDDDIKRDIESISKHISHCIVGDYELYEYVKDSFEHVHVIPALIDPENYKPDPNRKKNKKFLIIHAPTSPEIKGSSFIEKAVNELMPNYDFEYKLIKGMSHEDAKRNYAQADLIVDELHCGSYGLLSIETMAMAKPVITWISDYMKEKYPKELPIISANPDNIKEKIEYVLNNKDKLKELGQQGRAYVENHHDMNKVAKKIIELYQAL